LRAQLRGTSLLCRLAAHSRPRLHRFGCRTSVPGGRKLRVEAPKHFVALGAFGVRELQHALRPDKGEARTLGLVPCLAPALSHPLGDALSGKLGAVVELERHRCCSSSRAAHSNRTRTSTHEPPRHPSHTVRLLCQTFILERRRRLWHLLGSCRTVAAHILHALDYFQIKIAR